MYNSRLFSYLCRSIKSRSLRLTHQPSIRMPRWSRYDAEVKLVIHFKMILSMETVDFYAKYAAEFCAASTQSLVETFNKSVGNYGWSSMRATYHAALIDEFVRRGIDISAIHDGKSTSFAHRVVLSNEQNKLVIAEGK